MTNVGAAVGVVVADRYRLERQLGQGGMGTVWAARHVSLQIACAVKFIHPQAAQVPEIRARFEREAVAAAQLKSPHVVQIIDHGIWEGMPYIAMEMLDGEDLSQRLARLRTLPPPAVVTIVTQVARALAKSHTAGLVHRDLKPANIFLARDDEGETAKVLDFGVAKINALEATDASTKTGALLGTPYYMSPEQARGIREVDARSDLWSLAVVAFQCLTGRLPFVSAALGDLLVQIIMNPVPVPSQIAPVPPGFDAWWQRATARDPSQRFQTAKELAEALALALGVSSSSTALAASSPALVNPRASSPWSPPNLPPSAAPWGSPNQPPSGAPNQPTSAAPRVAPPSAAWLGPNLPPSNAPGTGSGGMLGHRTPMSGATPMPPAETGTPVVAPVAPLVAPASPKHGALIAVGAAVVLAGLATLVVLGSGSHAPSPASIAPPAPEPTAAVAAVASVATATARPEPAVEAAPPPSALPQPSAAPTASASAGPRAKLKPPGTPRDVGF